METTDKLSEFAVQTPTGFICKLCSREFDDRRRIICHLAKIKCNEVDDCPLVPEDVDKQLRQQLKLSRKRDSTSTHHSKRAAFSTRGLHLLATQVVGKQFDDYIGDIWSSLMCFGLAFVELEVLEKLSLPSILITSSFTVPTTFIMFSGLICLLLLIHFVICKLVFPWQWVYIYPMKMMKPKGQQNWQNCWLEKEKSLLILDDLWDFISLQDVGVPVGADGFTVLFTTRSLGVCRKVGCQREIEVHCLPPDESYELFKKELGKETTLSTEVEEMSRLVADKCFGLPFAITIMAREMKGVTDKHRWRNALSGQMRKKADMEIFQKLKITYDYLKDPTLQHCFLCCASLVDISRRKWRLADYLVDEGVIKKNMNTRMEELDEALTMLDFLRDAGLLEIGSSNYVSMNELIRSMALQMMEESQHGAIIKNHMSLAELPDVNSWTEDLVRVTLQNNKIENIPSNFSPSCPKLSTLVLTRNFELRCIGDSFFGGMPRLKLLDLSHTKIESLPQSVFGLVNLTTLLLVCCIKLKKIPSVAGLKALKKLDLTDSAVEEVPGDIERLSKLTYLDLSLTDIKELNFEIFAKLSNLQFLQLPCSLTVNKEVIGRLGRLEALSCSFSNVVELNNYLMHLEGGFKKRVPPLQLHVRVGRGSSIYASNLICDFEEHYAEKDDGWSAVALHNCDINHSDLWKYFQEIIIDECNGTRSLCKFFPIKGAAELEHFSVKNCDKLEFLCSLSATGQGILKNIKHMELVFLEKLSVLVRKEGDLPYDGSCFSNLTSFLIEACPSMKLLLPIHLMPNLENLQRLYVIDCPLMGEIFGAEVKEGESKMVEKKICSLPKLSVLWLRDLPELKSFCGGGTICRLPKSCSITIKECPKFTTDMARS